jgi:sugar phosphate isomerase/epimerase
MITLIALLTVFMSQGLAPAVSATSDGAVKETPVQQPSVQEALAVQLWSFRNDFKKDVLGTLKRVRAMGFTNVELAGYYDMTAQQFREALDNAGLKAIGMHIEYETARDKIDEVIREAKILGVQEVGVPWINSPFTKKDCLQAIDVFNRAGEKLAANGFRFFYHIHGYEFVPNKGGKGTLFDLLMEKTDPRYVSMQLDTYHVAFPGQEPLKLLQQYPGRFSSLHLKDIRKGFVGDNSGAYRESAARPMGQGKIHWPELLKAAQKEGIKWYVIEDETTAVWQGITASLKYLQTIADQSVALPSALPSDSQSGATAKAEKILALAREAKGGVARLKAVRDVIYTGDFFIYDQPNVPKQTLTMYLSQASKMRTEVDSYLSGFDGVNSWTSKGKDSDRGLYEKRRIAAREWFVSLLMTPPDIQAEVVSLPDAAVNGKLADVVAVTVGVSQFNLYFDKRTHLALKVSYEMKQDQDVFKMEELQEDYKDVQGIQLAHKQRGFYSGKLAGETLIKEYKLNTKIDAAKFTKP